jgi:amino acid adenylation domain-containing protein
MDETLSILNPIPTRLEGPDLLHELVSGPETPGIALEYFGADDEISTLSYLDLHRRSNHLSWRLNEVSRQISRKDLGIVPIYIPQCTSLYISQLAILKLGAAFCPLNLDVPEERLRFILKDTSAGVLLTTIAMQSKLPELEGIIVIAVDDEESKSESESDRESPGTSEDGTTRPDTSSLAYIMYTSGSTGLPKAVCLSHRAVTQSLLAHDRFIPGFSRFLQFASPTFDVSVFEIFFPWYRGATLVSVERNRLLSDLPGTITSLDIDAAELTPSVAASLVRTRENVPTLRTLLTIGEMLNTQVIQQFGSSDDKSGILYGMYGPTEAAIHCTLQPNFGNDLPAGTIGIPLDTVSCFIVKPAESAEHASEIEILPIGEVGELVVGGHQLADGYLNREQQTRTAFVTHQKYGSLYRTGDKACIQRDGTLQCYGRISSGQVKLRGQRVELGEIEHAASKAEECHAVIASVISGLLVLFCIGSSDKVSTKDIKSACQKWLPAYMIPSDIVLLDDFPYLPSGKVDKKKLESDYDSNTAQDVSGTSDVPESARDLARVIQSVLNVPINHSTDLSAAGLDSLRAIQVASELRRQGYAEIGALELLSVTNVLALYESMRVKTTTHKNIENDTSQWKTIVDELRSSVTKDLESRAVLNDIQEVLPCTPLQDAMLVETTRQPQAYCNELRIAVSPELPVERVRQALFALAERHPALRSGFCTSGVSHCAYAQVIWKTMAASQFEDVETWTVGWSVTNQETLLRPLRFQYKSSDAVAELAVNLHHALYDQWSVEIMLEDLENLLREEETPDRPSFEAVNKFFSLRKRDDQTLHLDFWREHLSDATSGRLPNLSSRAMSLQSLQSMEHTIEMDMDSLRQAAQKHSCSTHVFFQAAYAILLGIYMGTEDVVFGTVFSGRTLPIDDVEGMVGPLLSTLPSRINTTESRRFSDVLRRLQEDNREIMQHSMISLANIKKACGVTPGEALFDSIFVWQETARPNTRSQTLLKLVEARDYLEFSLTLDLEPTQHGVKAKATYQSSILPSQHVEILLQQIDALVKIAVARPDTLMSELSGQLPTSVLSVANPHPQSFIYKAGLGSLVENHASNSSDALALIFAHNIQEDVSTTESLTYGELNTRANQLANYLVSQGAEHGKLICVCMEKSVALYVSILAAVKAGCGYLPLVPETPSARIGQILADANVKLCLTDSSTASIIADVSSCHTINVTAIDLSSQSDTNPRLPFEPTNVAYAVFTSGTTGKPKGVLVTNENLLSNLEVLSKIYPVPERSRLLQACNQAFDVSVFEIFFTWYTGMCLCSASKDVMFRDFEKAINKLEVTHLSLTPTVAALTNPAHIPSVQFLVTAGEAVTPQVHSTWAGKGLYQGYGPSETTNICTVNPAVESDHVINNIGPPFENTSAFVLTQETDFQLVPLGGLGELCFGGQQVFRGYQDMPELTQSKIIDHPTYGRIYRSGDLGRLLPDGTILIQGRTDDQRKVRGQRIELGEISSRLLQHSSVQDCAIEIVRSADKERLMAFWIPTEYAKDSYSILRSDGSLGEITKTLFAHLADHLPIYMVPDALVPVSAIPQTSQGKIDKRRLARDSSALSIGDLSTYSQGSGDDDDETSELSETEKHLLSALADTLHMPHTSIYRSTSFFALGLDSMSAIRLATKLRIDYGYGIDVSQILKRPTIARLASQLQGDSQREGSTGTNERSAADFEAVIGSQVHESVVSQLREHGQTVQEVLPCTPLQEAMLSAQDTSGSSAYRNKTLFVLRGSVDKLRTCWEVMLQRHGILRTIFFPTDDPRFPFVQAVLSEWTLPWVESDSDLDHPSTLLESVQPNEVQPFEQSPPWEIQIYRSESTAYLLLDMHHALYDANAMSNLLYEVEQLYRDQSLPAPVSFNPFLDFMVSESIEEADKHFSNHLRGFVPKPFMSTEASQSGRGFGTVTGRLDYSPKVVESFLSKHSTTMLSLTQAMWIKTLSASQCYTDVCCGNVVSGRSVPVDGIESLVAPCFNTIPVRVDLSKHRSNLSLVKALQKASIDSLPYQLTPLRRIQARAGTNGKRLFDSLVLLQQDTIDLDPEIWSSEGESGVMDVSIVHWG